MGIELPPWRRPRKIRPVDLWTEADEANERRLYEANKLAFWLYPDRWADGPIMKFDEQEKSPMHDRLNGLFALAGRNTPPPREAFKNTRTPGVFVVPVVATDFSDGGMSYVRPKN